MQRQIYPLLVKMPEEVPNPHLVRRHVVVKCLTASTRR